MSKTHVLKFLTLGLITVFTAGLIQHTRTMLGFTAPSSKVYLAEGGPTMNYPEIEAISPDRVKAVFSKLPLPKSFVSQTDGYFSPRSTEKTLSPNLENLKLYDKKLPKIGKNQPLTVVRYLPEGQQDRVVNMSVTFNQPMVGLAKVGQAETRIPIIMPNVPQAQWRWLGTHTLLLECHESFPMATEYTVIVPSTVEDVYGNQLQESLNFTFTTGLPEVTYASIINQHSSTVPEYLLIFNQKVDPKQIIGNISFHHGSKKVKAQLASDHKSNIEHAFVVKPAKPLPYDTNYTLSVSKGFTGLEGPLKAPKDYTTQGKTHGELRPLLATTDETRKGIAFNQRGQLDKELTAKPSGYLNIKFSNPIDSKSVSEKNIHITPKIPGMTINPYHDSLEISGLFQGQTTYTIEVDKLEDVFGKKQQVKASLKLTTAPSSPQFHLPYQNEEVIPTHFGPQLYAGALNQKWFLADVYYTKNPREGAEKLREFQKHLWKQKQNFARSIPKLKGLTQTHHLNLDLNNNNQPEVVTIPLSDSEAKPGYYYIVSKVASQNRVSVISVHYTDIGFEEVLAGQSTTLRFYNLESGKSLNRGVVTIGGNSIPLDQQGLATFQPNLEPLIELERQGRKELFIGGKNSSYHERKVFFLEDDRGLYKPGETAYFKGWLRSISGPQGKPQLPHKDYQLIVEAKDSRGQELQLTNKAWSINQAGGFNGSLKLPKNINLGQVLITLQLKDGDTFLERVSHRINVQEFRTPEFEVELTGPQERVLWGESHQLSLNAKYYSGEPFSDAKTAWYFSYSPSFFTPAGWSHFNFNARSGFWGCFDWYARSSNYHSSFSPQQKEGNLDKQGQETQIIPFPELEEGKEVTNPIIANTNVRVIDKNQQELQANSSTLLFPSKVLIGLKPLPYFQALGRSIQLETVAVSLEGQAVSGQEITLEVWNTPGYGDQQEPQKVWSKTVPSKKTPNQLTFTPQKAGTYTVKAYTTNDQGKKVSEASDSIYLRSAQSRFQLPTDSSTLSVVTDKEQYKPGDKASIVVFSNFTEGKARIAYGRQGLLNQQVVELKGGQAEFTVPITEELVPSLHFSLSAFGFTEEEPKRIQYLSHSGRLPISLESKKLTTTITLPKGRQKPGSQVPVNIHLANQQGEPAAQADLSLWMVDEAILATAQKSFNHPADALWPSISHGLNFHYNLDKVSATSSAQDILSSWVYEGGYAEKEALYECATADFAEASPRGSAHKRMQLNASPASDGSGKDIPSIELRENFSPIVEFIGSVQTDKQGNAKHTFTLPDNLTRYRLIAVSADQLQYGFGESSLTAGMPFAVRPMAPRFLNISDRSTLWAVIQNFTDTSQEIEVYARGSNLKLQDSGKKLRLEAGSRIEVPFTIEAQKPGVAAYQVAIISDTGYSDAVEQSFPVYEPGSVESFAVQGNFDDQPGVQLPLDIPLDSYPSFGGLELGLSPSIIGSSFSQYIDHITLTDFNQKLSGFWANRLIVLSALNQVKPGLRPEGWTQEQIEQEAQKSLEHLSSFERQDGNYLYSEYHSSVYELHNLLIAEALQQAQQQSWTSKSVHKTLKAIQGYNWTQSSILDRIRYYHLLGNSKMNPEAFWNKHLQLETKDLKKLSTVVLGRLDVCLNQLQTHPHLRPAIRTELLSRIDETTASVRISEGPVKLDSRYALPSHPNGTAWALRSFITDGKSELAAKIVQGVSDNDGRQATWSNSAWQAIALAEYSKTMEAQLPSYTAQVLVPHYELANESFQGYQEPRYETEVPSAWLQQEQPEKIAVLKEGAGRLYYRLGLRYIPRTLQLEPQERGFSVERTIKPLKTESPDSIWTDDTGAVHIKLGTKARIHWSVFSSGVRNNVAIDDPLPAGLENLLDDNPESGPKHGLYWLHNGWDYWSWLTHLNYRDERVEAFIDHFNAGYRSHSYTVKATAPGTYTWSPMRVHTIDEPETYGRSAGLKVVVEE